MTIRRRGNNEGCIYRRSSGRWRAQVTVDGRRLSKTFNTRGEAQQWIRQILDQIDGGLTYISTKRTLAEHLDTWMEYEKPVLRPSSYLHYELIVRKFLIPNLGEYTLRDLR